MQVRRYRPSDARACIELFSQLTEAHRILYHDPTIGSKDPARTFRAHLRETRGGGTWVAVERDQVIGLSGLIAHRGWGEAEPVVVLQGHRRRGVARALVHAVIEEARRRRYRVLTIKPVARNTVALRTFHALGFRTLGHIELDMPLRGPGWFRPIPGPKIVGRRFSV